MLYGREPKPEDNLENVYGDDFADLPLELFAEHENFDRIVEEYAHATNTERFFDGHFEKLEGAGKLLQVYGGDMFRVTDPGSFEERLAVLRERTYVAGVGLMAGLVTFGGPIKQPSGAEDIREMYRAWKSLPLGARQQELTEFLDLEGARIIADTLFTDMPGSLRSEMIEKADIVLPATRFYPRERLELRGIPMVHADFDEGIVAALHLIRYYGMLRQDVDFNVPNTPME